MIQLRPYQLAAIDQARAHIASGTRRILINAPTGAGKCLGKGTPILMYDGSIKPVEDVTIGDLLMGPDSTPRKVLSIARGREEMFRVIPSKGDPYIVNRSHILSLVMTGNKGAVSGYYSGETVNISVREYLSMNVTFKHCAKGWRTGVDFPETGDTLPIPPYILGIWLGDGFSDHPAICSADQEVINAWEVWGASYGLKSRHEPGRSCENVHLTTGERGGVVVNPVLNLFRSMDLLGNKHIPQKYLASSRENRLQLLAGILDTDGYYDGRSYNITIKQKHIADGIAFLCRSLGLAAYIRTSTKTIKSLDFSGEYFSVSISGSLEKIPNRVPRRKSLQRKQIKDVLRVGITVQSIGEGKYYGFEISGDRLFLLGDFTVTHNTVIGAKILEGAYNKGSPTLFLAHRRELIEQSAAKIHDAGIQEYGIIMAGAGRNNSSALVQVASVQTLIRRELPPAKIIMIDECHRAAAKTYRDIVANYPDAVVIGLSATPERQDGKGLDDLFDSIVTVSTIPELIEQGFLMAPMCYVGRASPDLSHVPTRGGDYAEGALEQAMDKPMLIGDMLSEWKRLGNNAATVVFATGVDHSKHIAEAFWQAGIPAASVDGNTPVREREAVIADWKRGAIKVVSNCMVFTEGFDFPELEVCILARPTKSIGLYLQTVGRVMRTAPGKMRALVLDHAGCVELHGAPSIHREWSLHGEKERRKKNLIPELAQCHECQMIYTVEPKFFMESNPAKKLLVCPGCGMADCPHCAALFKPQRDRETIEDLYQVLSVVCPECGSLFTDDKAHAINGAHDGTLPVAADGEMVEYDPTTIPLSVRIKNDYKRLMKQAQERGWKRGKVWHELAKDYDRGALNAALPRHTGAWWKGQA